MAGRWGTHRVRGPVVVGVGRVRRQDVREERRRGLDDRKEERGGGMRGVMLGVAEGGGFGVLGW